MNPYILRIGLFLFGSGFCALVYQMAWLRMLRLIFGSSTNASAAVLAIFMGGLGLGGYLLGKRGDRSKNPLNLYANLEFGISLAAALSPLLVAGVRALYVGVGGTSALGDTVGSTFRLVLAAVVLAVPTFLMGGTLPAAVRAITRKADSGRHSVGLLYAFNTLGAVVGTLLTTFVLLELVGIKQTIWVAALLNLIIALVARATARERGMLEEPAPEEAEAEVPAAERTPRATFRLVLTASCVVGFVFFLMELVWYRMMGPILGGSTYTFGIILMVALLGIGAGGLIYGMTTGNRRPTGLHFAVTCALEALFIILPFAAGDSIAHVALEMRGLQAGGFGALAMTWALVATVVVLPASLIAGYQFPLLVAILGSGRRGVAREVGLTYAWNTVGAIAGSIAGGFGLIPLLSAPTAWKLSAWLLVVLAAMFLALEARHGAGWRRLATGSAIGLVAVLLTLSTGPTAFWRHSGIGAGRFGSEPHSPNNLRDSIHFQNRTIRWETDGRESSVALVQTSGLAFFVNGKSDGSARDDAPTQVMSPLIGAILHANPTDGLVIGLGTGSSAGWLAEVDSIERVDVVELEPAILRVAEECHTVNRNALDNPKVHVEIADGREFLLTSDRKYDVIFSEPSNPYRAGVSSLFTREFYEAAARGMKDGGILIQWLQGYEVDAQVVRTAYATLGSVFPHVETWVVQVSDLLLVASASPIQHDLDRIRARLEEEPFRSAMSAVWGVSGAEGFYSAYAASPAFAAAVAEVEGDAINTDDHPIIEFGFARHVGRLGRFSIPRLRELAELRGESRPPLPEDALDWQRVEDARNARRLMFTAPQLRGRRPRQATPPDKGAHLRMQARDAYLQGNLNAAYELWMAQDGLPSGRIDLLLMAESLADAGDERALEVAAELAELAPVEGRSVMARWHLRNGEPELAAEELIAAFRLIREDPWTWQPHAQRATALAMEIGRASPELGRRLFEELAEPFAAEQQSEARLFARLTLAHEVDRDALCVEAHEAYEPWIPWTEPFLRRRRDCYEATNHPLAVTAQRQLEDFYAEGEVQLWWGLLPEQAFEGPELEMPSEATDSRSLAQ